MRRFVMACILSVVFPALIPAGPVPAQESGEVWTEPSTGMAFVWVDGGCFAMGCGEWTSGCTGSEYPVHEVCLDGFWLGRFEVTQGQWLALMGGNPSTFDSGDEYPVDGVSWEDAHVFLERLKESAPEGIDYRLPTEAEWEYACRSGGRPEVYAGGDDEYAVACGYGCDHPQPVGSRAPNGLGLYDMSGNVDEWVEDRFLAEGYTLHARDNPLVAEGGDAVVSRGGAWGSHRYNLRCTARRELPPSYTGDDQGFRVVRVR